MTSLKKNKAKVLAVVMDGIGVREERHGNAVALAATPALDYLKASALYTTLKASGPAVGLPSEKDIGNSEVGHNTLGAGRCFDQGAKLVNQAIESGKLFKGKVWRQAIKECLEKKSTLHFLGLLSDGNVHSHEEHLFAMLRQAAREGVQRIRIHTLLDGRDVEAHSAERFITNLQKVLSELPSSCDARIASGGGRMHITMDRYEADWSMVERGWKTHVLGEADFTFTNIEQTLEHFRKEAPSSDQYLPSFVITEKSKPIGTIHDGDSVILFNFRGDRSIEITRAFEEENFNTFDRKRHPRIFFAGLLEYDGDLHIPKHYLVSPPAISNTLGEKLCSMGLRQFACSETQKYGHVTYFWNGNRSGYIDQKLEEYLEIPSDTIPFHLKPWMKAHEITEATIQRMSNDTFDFARINYANGDMVGHTGDLEASIIAVATVDLMIHRLILAAQKTGTTLLITADHGNCDEMFEKGADPKKDFNLWDRPKAKTSHTLADVPCYIYNPRVKNDSLLPPGTGTLANIANTVLQLLGHDQEKDFESSLLI